MKIPRIVFAAPSSGSGKTVTVCALLKALSMQDRKAAAYKCGPDYIDPMFHREVLGIETGNLDLFFCEREKIGQTFCRQAKDKDIAVIEGVMGYYDGISMDSYEASSYDVARTLKAPVILILSPKGMALSAAAIVEGIICFQKDSNIRGIILNRTGEHLYPRMKQMLEEELKRRGYEIPVLGYLPEEEVFSLESRHLGLVTPAELKGLQEKMKEAGRRVSETVELERLFKIAASAPEFPDRSLSGDQSRENIGIHMPGRSLLRIAVAKDEAFGFYYRDNIEVLQELGCELIEFSPLSDTRLPEGIKGLLLGGGYPELYAKTLAENEKMRRAVKEAVEQGIPCLAECGGFMYLHETLSDREKNVYPMAGVIKGHASFRGKLVRFGYIHVEGNCDGTYLKKGEVIRGHEFHYWDSTDNGSACVARKPDGKRSWNCIHESGNLFAGYPHLYLPSFLPFAERFVQACADSKVHTGENTI